MGKAIIKSILVIVAMGCTFVVGYMTGIEHMEQEAIDRRLGAYCPTNAQFSWMGIMEPADLLMQTTDCPE